MSQGISVVAVEHGRPHRLKQQTFVSLGSGGCEEPFSRCCSSPRMVGKGEEAFPVFVRQLTYLEGIILRTYLTKGTL